MLFWFKVPHFDIKKAILNSTKIQNSKNLPLTQKLSQKIPKSKNFHCALICENSKISKIFFQKKISQIFQKPPLNSPPLKREFPLQIKKNFSTTKKENFHFKQEKILPPLKRETSLANSKRILTNPPCLKQSF